MGWLEDLSDRATYLLKGQEVEWVRQDGRRTLTIKFLRGPFVHIDIQAEPKTHLELSIVEGPDVTAEWIERAESADAPPPPRRNKFQNDED